MRTAAVEGGARGSAAASNRRVPAVDPWDPLGGHFGRRDGQLFAPARAQRVYHEQDQVTKWDLLHGERPEKR